MHHQIPFFGLNEASLRSKPAIGSPCLKLKEGRRREYFTNLTKKSCECTRTSLAQSSALKGLEGSGSRERKGYFCAATPISIAA